MWKKRHWGEKILWLGGLSPRLTKHLWATTAVQTNLVMEKGKVFEIEVVSTRRDVERGGNARGIGLLPQDEKRSEKNQVAGRGSPKQRIQLGNAGKGAGTHWGEGVRRAVLRSREGNAYLEER